MSRSLSLLSPLAFLLPVAPAAPVPKGTSPTFFPAQLSAGVQWVYREDSGSTSDRGIYVVTRVGTRDGATVVSIGHRSTLDTFHQDKVALEPAGDRFAVHSVKEPARAAT